MRFLVLSIVCFLSSCTHQREKNTIYIDDDGLAQVKQLNPERRVFYEEDYFAQEKAFKLEDGWSAMDRSIDNRAAAEKAQERAEGQKCRKRYR